MTKELFTRLADLQTRGALGFIYLSPRFNVYVIDIRFR